MRRREFIALLGGGVAGWPLAARAQQPERMRRIGVLTPFIEGDQEAKAWLTAFQEGLQQLGWAQGRNVSIDYRWAEDRLQINAAELVKMAPDVLFAAATPALEALRQQTHSLPIVFVQVSDPVKLGLVANLARPGGNITGFTNFEHAIGGKWLELIRDTAPGAMRVLVIFEPDISAQLAYLQAIEAAAPTFRVELARASVRNAAEIERAIDAFAQEPKGALIVVPSALGIAHCDLIVARAARHHLPAIYPYPVFARGGGFISYGVDLADLYRRADLVNRQVAVIAATSMPAALAAKAATTTIPIVYEGGADPVEFGLVASLNRPGGNVTGVSNFSGSIAAKIFELLHELIPNSEMITVLVNPTNPSLALSTAKDAEAAGRALGRQIQILNASTADEIDAAFATLAQLRAGALLIGSDAFFNSRRVHLAMLAARYRVPALLNAREFPTAGGLMSYGASITDAYRQTGVYTGKVLKGARPADLPVLQPTKFELVINVRTAKALGLEVPPTLLARADEVIE